MLTKPEKFFIWAIDLGFLAYWSLVIFKLLPAETMFKGYEMVEVQAWNWSFLPLDLLASITGILGNTTKTLNSKVLITVSLVLTACAGGMALSYWAFKGDFELVWWLPNIILLLVPIKPLVRLVRN
jgi:Family of unknown function (DUF5360)